MTSDATRAFAARVTLRRASVSVLAVSITLAACGGGSPSPDTPSGPQIVHETIAGSISAGTSPACSSAFRASVDPFYFAGGTGRCQEYRYHPTTAGTVSAQLTWQDPRLDLDLVLNDGIGRNFQQSIAANRCCETVSVAVSADTTFVLVIYLRGVDPQFIANGGTFDGEVATPFTLQVERPR